MQKVDLRCQNRLIENLRIRTLSAIAETPWLSLLCLSIRPSLPLRPPLGTTRFRRFGISCIHSKTLRDFHEAMRSGFARQTVSTLVFTLACSLFALVAVRLHYTLPTPLVEEFNAAGVPVFSEARGRRYIEDLSTFPDGSPRCTFCLCALLRNEFIRSDTDRDCAWPHQIGF